MLIKLLLWLGIIEVSSYQYRYYKDSKSNLYPGWSSWLNFSGSIEQLKRELDLHYSEHSQTRKLYSFK